ncbi:MAG: hypothetical protein J0I90_09265 [Nitrosospira sp.]|jgi:hypothetical protein|nr:hypothetical protein [Nitrosospira sp.]MBN9127751.1 hypothetical protein [Nitrosospira sp.]OJY14356.1 MAG: hypothetical protein BGO99_12510 [Nitrosospira sp. 56-18]
MTVKELIEELAKFDQKQDVFVSHGEVTEVILVNHPGHPKNGYVFLVTDSEDEAVMRKLYS